MESMVRLTHLFINPADPAEFEDYFSSTYLPLLREIPGVLRTEISRVYGVPLGEVTVHAMIDQYFADEDSMHRAMASAGGKKLSRELMANPKIKMELLASIVAPVPGESA